MQVLRFPYPRTPPPSPYLDGRVGYEHIATGVRAAVTGGVLETPVPRAAFHAEELALAFELGADFRAAHAEANVWVEPNSPRLDVETGLGFLRYVMARGDLRRGWPSADIIIPDLLFFARRDTHAATTVLVWPEAVRALVIPDAAEHIVVRLGSAPHRTAFLPRAAVLAVAAELALPFLVPAPHRLYRGGSAHARVIAELRKLPGEPAASFRAARPDEVRDSGAKAT